MDFRCRSRFRMRVIGSREKEVGNHFRAGANVKDEYCCIMY